MQFNLKCDYYCSHQGGDTDEQMLNMLSITGIVTHSKA